MRKLLFLCLLPLMACMGTPPPSSGLPPGVTQADIDAHNAELDAEMARCDEAKVRQIVQQNLPKAMSYPANSAHREVYIEAIYTQFDHMKIGLRQAQREKCEIIQHEMILQERLKLEGDK